MTILQDSTNDLLFYKQSALESPYFLIRLVNKITAKEFVCLDQSMVVCPFIQLELLEVGKDGSEDPLNASIKIDTGSYDLYLYDQLSSTNLDYTLANSELFKGEAYVYSDEDLDRTFL